MLEKPKLAAIAVVIRADQVLLVKRRNEPDAGLWGFPGGHVDLGETALDAAARELLEETGVIGVPLRYLTNVDVIIRDAKGRIEHHFLLAAVLCTYTDGDPQPDDDVSDARWIPTKDILTGHVDTSQYVDAVLKLALQESLDGV